MSLSAPHVNAPRKRRGRGSAVGRSRQSVDHVRRATATRYPASGKDDPGPPRRATPRPPGIRTARSVQTARPSFTALNPNNAFADRETAVGCGPACRAALSLSAGRRVRGCACFNTRSSVCLNPIISSDNSPHHFSPFRKRFAPLPVGLPPADLTAVAGADMRQGWHLRLALHERLGTGFGLVVDHERLVPRPRMF